MYVFFIVVVSIALTLDLFLTFLFRRSKSLIAQIFIILAAVLITLVTLPLLNILAIGCIGGPVGSSCDQEYQRISDPVVLYFLLFPLFMLFLKKTKYGIYILVLLFLILLLTTLFFSLRPVLNPIAPILHPFISRF